MPPSHGVVSQGEQAVSRVSKPKLREFKYAFFTLSDFSFVFPPRNFPCLLSSCVWREGDSSRSPLLFAATVSFEPILRAPPGSVTPPKPNETPQLTKSAKTQFQSRMAFYFPDDAFQRRCNNLDCCTVLGVIDKLVSRAIADGIGRRRRRWGNPL